MADDPVTIDKVTIIPVVKVSWMKKDTFFSGLKKPEAVVLLGPWGKKALEISGKEVPLEKFLEEVSGLKETINNILSTK